MACMRPSTTAWMACGIASTPPIRISVPPCAFMTWARRAHVVVVEEGGIDLRDVVTYRLPGAAVRNVPIRRIGRQDRDTGTCR